MIVNDQPTCFPDNVLVKFSSKNDGTVLDRAVGVHNPSVVTNRTRFCDALGVSYGDVVFQRIVYDNHQTYEEVARVNERDTTKRISEVAADALYTTTKNIGLLLPVADCIATVFYDPIRGALAVAHLGRHSSLAGLIDKLLDVFVTDGSNLAELVVWMSPHAQKQSYALDFFTYENEPDWQDFFKIRDGKYYLDMAGHNKATMIRRGVTEANIHISPIDTVNDENYFAHSAGDTTGRMALLAMMR